MYLWRKLNDVERQEVLKTRRELQRPWHGPPHREGWQTTQYHITAACYEHASIIGKSTARMDDFCEAWLGALSTAEALVHAWCLLPNHYHALITALDLKQVILSLGQLHGRTSHTWNKEEGTQGRHCWHRATDRAMRGEGHFWATTNYIHHNPVRHGYVARWTEWPWSSAHEYLNEIGKDEAAVKWKTFPVLQYGDGWDDAKL